MSRVINSRVLIARQIFHYKNYEKVEEQKTKLFQTSDGIWHQIWHQDGKVLIRDLDSLEDAEVLPEVDKR